MINRIVEEKYIDFEDVRINEYLETDKGDFNLERYYIGGLDENGDEWLEGSCGCIISLNEVTQDVNHTAIKDLASILSDYEVKIEEETIYMTFPDIRQSLTIDNYDSESTTETIIQTIKDYLGR